MEIAQAETVRTRIICYRRSHQFFLRLWLLPIIQDPFIWRTSRGYHLLLHSLGRAPGSSGGSTQGAGGLAYSKDGLEWTWVNGSDSLQGAVYSPNVTWSDGTKDGLTRRQAPYLYIDPTGTIQFLLNGVDTAAGLGCHWRTSWTLLQRVRSNSGS